MPIERAEKILVTIKKENYMIIILNGPPSSGKSSIAGQLVRQSKEITFRHVEADDIFNPERQVSVDESRKDGISYVMLSTAAFVNKLVSEGKNVIWEGPFTYRRQLACEIAKIDEKKCVYLVNVKCSLELCQSREILRCNRPVGFAEQLYSYTYDAIHMHDIEVDTTLLSPKENARIILDFISLTPYPKAFEQYLTETSIHHE